MAFAEPFTFTAAPVKLYSVPYTKHNNPITALSNLDNLQRVRHEFAGHVNNSSKNYS